MNDTKVYFLSDFALLHEANDQLKDKKKEIVFKNHKNKSNSLWNADRERASRRGRDGRFGSLGIALKVLTDAKWKQAAFATASTLGIPTATYLAVRAKYRQGIPQSAAIAQNNAASVPVPDLGSGKKQITFTIGGFDGNNKTSFTLKDSLKHDLTDHHLVPIVQADFNVKNQLKQGQNQVVYAGKQLKEVMRVFYGSVAQNGRNPVSVQLASQAYAYHLKYPNKRINFIGHSAGGIIAHEAADILEQMGVRTRTVSLGSPYMGFAKHRSTSSSITIFNNNDPLIKLPSMNPIVISNAKKSIEAHLLPTYTESAEVKRRLKDFFK